MFLCHFLPLVTSQWLLMFWCSLWHRSWLPSAPVLPVRQPVSCMANCSYSWPWLVTSVLEEKSSTLQKSWYLCPIANNKAQLTKLMWLTSQWHIGRKKTLTPNRCQRSSGNKDQLLGLLTWHSSLLVCSFKEWQIQARSTTKVDTKLIFSHSYLYLLKKVHMTARPSLETKVCAWLCLSAWTRIKVVSFSFWRQSFLWLLMNCIVPWWIIFLAHSVNETNVSRGSFITKDHFPVGRCKSLSARRLLWEGRSCPFSVFLFSFKPAD